MKVSAFETTQEEREFNLRASDLVNDLTGVSQASRSPESIERDLDRLLSDQGRGFPDALERFAGMVQRKLLHNLSPDRRKYAEGLLSRARTQGYNRLGAVAEKLGIDALSD